MLEWHSLRAAWHGANAFQPGKPLACLRNQRQPNQTASVDAPSAPGFAFYCQWRRATEQHGYIAFESFV